MLSTIEHQTEAVVRKPDPTSQRRIDNSERFVAFAFAGAEMVVETDACGIVTYAAGAFRGKFAVAAETFVGRALRELVAPVDHEALETALLFLIQRGRLQPLMIRLSDPGRTHVSLAGIALPAQGRPLSLNFSFARPPAPLASVLQAGTPHALARATEARLRAGTPCDLGLLEIAGDGSLVISSNEHVGRALEAVAPDVLATEIAPGRFGLLRPTGTEADLLLIAALLEQALHSQGVDVTIAAHHLSLSPKGLTPVQAARALRQALNVFARGGGRALSEAGFDGGLAGYIRRAGTQATTLRQVIRRNNFTLAFQPIVSLADRSVHHFEALIRPNPPPDRSFSGPQDFIMMIEALGLADELDLTVARLACEAADKANVRVAFNISGQSVQSPGFRDRLVRLLEASPARQAGLIIIEMTETAEIEDLQEAVRTAEGLRSLGVPFCLDDFGAGAIDIRLLRALIPNIVKLDGSYIPGLTQGGREHALIAGMVEIARGAGAGIVAERVETEAEAGALTKLGVQYGQGWLFGHPGSLPARRPEPYGSIVGGRRTGRRTSERESWG